MKDENIRSLIELVPNEGAKEYLNEAHKFLENNEFNSSMGNSCVAFRILQKENANQVKYHNLKDFETFQKLTPPPTDIESGDPVCYYVNPDPKIFTKDNAEFCLKFVIRSIVS